MATSAGEGAAHVLVGRRVLGYGFGREVLPLGVLAHGDGVALGEPDPAVAHVGADLGEVVEPAHPAEIEAHRVEDLHPGFEVVKLGEAELAEVVAATDEVADPLGHGGVFGGRDVADLPRCAVRADVACMSSDESLWQASVCASGITSGAFYAKFRGYLRMAGLAPTGLHVLRHAAAKLRRDAGASIEAVSSFLDHSSLAVTTVYLRRLEGETDRTWPDVALAIGLYLLAGETKS
jgi:Phage integrase family